MTKDEATLLFKNACNGATKSNRLIAEANKYTKTAYEIDTTKGKVRIDNSQELPRILFYTNFCQHTNRRLEPHTHKVPDVIEITEAEFIELKHCYEN